MAARDSVSVLDHSLVTPKSSAMVAEMSLPLIFPDLVWLHFSPIERLVLYEIPQLSKSQFLDNIIPSLKNSLSLTLKHFLPLAGNLIIPPDSESGAPKIRYTTRDSVALLVAECNNVDFNHLASSDERNCAEFRGLIPQLKSSSVRDHSGSVMRTSPVLAFQITFFPDGGFSIGISNHHAAGDASSMFNFMKTWAILHSKMREEIDADDEESRLVSDSLPIFDKTLIKDTKGGLAKIMLDQWNDILKRYTNISSELTTKTNKVRKSFVITTEHIDKLKNLVLRKGEKVVHLSSFTVICSYIWTCLVRSRSAGEESVDRDEEEDENFLCTVDCRGRLDPPLPANFFGNCLTDCLIIAKHGQLAGEEGFQVAVELMGRAIQEKSNKDALFSVAEPGQLMKIMYLNWDKTMSVAGSNRYNYYDLNFGWGKPVKFEFISIDRTGAISLSGCKDSSRNVEVGLSLSKTKMNVFSSIFMEGLNAL